MIEASGLGQPGKQDLHVHGRRVLSYPTALPRTAMAFFSASKSEYYLHRSVLPVSKLYGQTISVRAVQAQAQPMMLNGEAGREGRAAECNGLDTAMCGVASEVKGSGERVKRVTRASVDCPR